MCVSIQVYRSRIGSFLPKIKRKVQKLVSFRNLAKNSYRPMVSSVLLLSVVYFLLSLNNDRVPLTARFQYVGTCLCNVVCPIEETQASIYVELSNFSARYLYGNRQTKGLKIAHFNKGSGFLASKKYEIECLISKTNPHILGISEANLFKDDDLSKVRIADYELHASLTIENPNLQYSRIVVYSHQSIVCKLRMDLMSQDYSSIWMQVGLPNQKQILVCQTYREWQLLKQENGSSKSVEAQMNRWIIFLDQWERALDTGMEVIVTGDMNLNHLDWTSPPATQSSQTTKLRPLIDKLFQSIFSHSVSQCVTVPTRFMNGQSPSGLDHFYTNRPEKLSVVDTLFTGASDHKLIFATRYSKVRKQAVRYLHKRCFKDFDKEAFLAELSNVH